MAMHHVLVVDDSPSIRQMVVMILEEEGIETTEANNGRDALAKLEKNQSISCVLLDLNMPVMGGVELIKAVRQQDCYRSLPLIVLTKDDQKSRRQEVLDCGATGHLVKPFDPDQLLQAVTMVLPGNNS